MAGVKRRKRRRTKSVKGKLTEWLQDKLEGDKWAEYSCREIGGQAKVSHEAASREVPRLVAEITERPLQEVQAVRVRLWKRSHATPFEIFSLQQLRQKGWTLKNIANLVGLSPTGVRKHTLAPCVELPSNTSEREISDQLRQVLADELGIGISPDGTTHRLDRPSPPAEHVDEARQDDLKAEAPELSTPPPESEIAPLANEESLKQDSDIVQNTGAPRSPTATDSLTQSSNNPVHAKIDAAPLEKVSSDTEDTDIGQKPVKKASPAPHDENVELPDDIVIYIVQQLSQKGYSVPAILRENIPNLTEALVFKCLDHPRMPMPDGIDPNYEPIMNQRQLFPKPYAHPEDENRFFWGR